MLGKFRKSLTAVGVLVFVFLTTTPAHSETPTAVTQATGVINVVKKVINDDDGTKVPSDFTLNLKHWGSDVEGSPFKGVDGAGTKFVLPPGTYVVMEPVTDGYLGSWSGVGVKNGFIDLQAGQEITITRTSDDIGMSSAVVTETTEEGGMLPATSSPWFNLFAVGLLLTLAGGLGVRLASRVPHSDS